MVQVESGSYFLLRAATLSGGARLATMDQDEARRAKVLAAKKKLKKFQNKRTDTTEGSVGKTHGRHNSTTSSVSSAVSSISKSNDQSSAANPTFGNHDASQHSAQPSEAEKHLSNALSPDGRMASELFSDSPASSAFSDFVPDRSEEIARLTDRLRELEAKERINEASLKDINAEYQKASQELQKFDPVLIASTQKQLEDARHTVSQLRAQLSQEEQKMESMEYEISGLRQKLSHQEEKLSNVKETLEKSEEERKELGGLLRLANSRAEELDETAKQHQQKVEQYEKENDAAESILKKAQEEVAERDTLIAELQRSVEQHTSELGTHKRDSSNATKQLKALSEKAEKLGKENRTLIGRLDEMKETISKMESDHAALQERLRKSESNESDRSSALANLATSQHRLSEAESSLEACSAELEREKQLAKTLREQLENQNVTSKTVDLQTDFEKPLRTLQSQLDVERNKSREVLSQLETVRNDMAELRRRYMFILEENKQLNELVEAEVFEGDEFGAGMKEYEVNGGMKFTPESALSPGQYASYEYERRRIIKRARAGLLQLQERATHDTAMRGLDPHYSGLGSERSSSSFDSYRHFTNSPLPPRIKPQHQAFMDVPRCSGCLGSAIEV